MYTSIYTGVYSSTDWPPLTGDQNSILNLKKSNAWREWHIYSFLPVRVINGVKSPYKKKNAVQRMKCMQMIHLFLLFFFYKIMAPIFQIIHTWNKTLNPDINRGLERRCEVKRLLQGLLTFWHLTSKGKESPGTRLHKVWTGRKKVGLMLVFK